MNTQEKLQLRAMSMDLAVRAGAAENAVVTAQDIYNYLTQDTVVAVPQVEAPVIYSSGTIRPFEKVIKE